MGGRGMGGHLVGGRGMGGDMGEERESRNFSRRIERISEAGPRASIFLPS